MILVHNEPGGRVKREPTRKWDRLPAVRYGRPVAARPVTGHWVPTLMEEWALRPSNARGKFLARPRREPGRCIGVSLQDDRESLVLPAHQRPGLVRLGALTFGKTPGGVLIESRDDLGDNLSRAVVCRWLQGRCEVFLPAGDLHYHKQRQPVLPVSRPKLQEWEEQAEQQAGSTAVEDALAAYKDAVLQVVTAETVRQDKQPKLDFVTYLGSGPMRNTDLARKEYTRLHAEEWTDREKVLAERVLLPAEPGTPMDETPNEPEELPTGTLSTDWIPVRENPNHRWWRDQPTPSE